MSEHCDGDEAGDIRAARFAAIRFLRTRLRSYGTEVIVRSCIRVLGEMNLQEISLVVRVTPERVRQLEALALRKLLSRARLMPELREWARDD